MSKYLNLDIQPQPDDTTCGPTCLHAIYDYFEDRLPMARVIREVRALKEGGTLAVLLASHALRRGYAATIYTYNLQLFDPSWFETGACIPDKIREQMRIKKSKKLQTASQAYLEFFKLGGKVLYEDLSESLIRRYLNRSIPILTGLSSTYLYQAIREFGPECEEDDIRGEPQGHFVVLSGYNGKNKTIRVADPMNPNPFSPQQQYSVPIERLIGAILLGIVTYDANLLILEPLKKEKKG